METVVTWIRAILTGLLLAMTVWWLVIVSSKMSGTPTVDAGGNVILDEFQRAKDILLVVLPLLTTALGYWFGAAGKAKAEEKAENAQDQLKGVLDSSKEPGLIEAARAKYPKAFGLPETR